MLIAKQATEAFARRVHEEYTKASLSPAEAKAMEYIEPKRSQEKTPGQIVRILRQKITEESLLDASKRLDNLRR